MTAWRHTWCRVSRAWYPPRVECCVSASRFSQIRRLFLLFTGALLQKRPARPAPSMWLAQPAPETPMPEEPLIRVLETFDLSATNVEHFLDSKADLQAIDVKKRQEMPLSVR